jgi:ABC-type lipoprotein release transport system permease subunit
MFGVSVLAYEVVTPTADIINEKLRDYAFFSSGFVTIVETKYPRGGIVSYYNPFETSNTLDLTELQKAYPISQADVEELAQMEHVRNIFPAFFFESEYITFENATHVEVYAINVLAVNPHATEVALLPFANIETGRFIAVGEQTCVINQLLTREENAFFTFNIGSMIPITILNTECRYEAVGIIGYGLPDRLMHGLGVVMNIESLWEVLRVSEAERRYNVVFIQIDSSDNAKTVIDELDSIYQSQNIELLWQSQQSWASTRLLETTAQMYNIMKLFVLISTAASIIILSMIKASRIQRDTGLLITLGWRDSDVIRHQLIGVVSEAILGAVLGIISSYVFGGTLVNRSISDTLRYGYGLFLEVPSQQYIIHVIPLMIGLTSLSLITVYWHNRGLTPMEMLRET